MQNWGPPTEAARHRLWAGAGSGLARRVPARCKGGFRPGL